VKLILLMLRPPCPRIKIRGWKGRLSAFADIRTTHEAYPLSTKADNHNWQPQNLFWGQGCVTSALLSCLACLLLGAAPIYAAAPAKISGGPPLGTAAPDWSLLDVNGKQFRLADYRGKTVVLNFWAFWCDTWKAETPSLKELAGRQQDMNFTLLAASVDGTRLSEFQRRTAGTAIGAVPFPVLMDVGGQVSARYRVRHVPTVVIIGPDGTVRFTADGYPGNFVILRELRKIER